MCICKCVFESEMTNNKQENAFGSHVRGTWAEKTVSKAAPAELKQWVSVKKTVNKENIPTIADQIKDEKA